MSSRRALAEAAHSSVQGAIGKSLESKFRTACLGFPSLVKQAGLCQALEFMHSRGEADEGAKKLLEALASAHSKANGQTLNSEQLRAHARTANMTSYLLLTRRVLDASVWLRRFALADLKPETEQE